MLARFAWLLLAGCGRVYFDPRSDALAGGPDAIAGPNGNVLSLDGMSYVSIDSVCNAIGNTFTMQGWFFLSSAQVENNAVSPMSINSQSASGNYVLALWDHTDDTLKYYDDVYTSRMQSTTTVPSDQWHFLTVTFDVGHGVLYSDGVVFSDVQTPQRITAPCRVSIGQEFDTTPSDLMVGLVDEVSVWSVAKTQQEIAAAMNANPTGSEPDLIAYYQFENGVMDLSGHGNTAVLQVNAAIVPMP